MAMWKNDDEMFALMKEKRKQNTRICAFSSVGRAADS